MKTTFKNIQTGELVSIYDFGKKGEVFVTTEKDDREKGSRFVVKYSNMLTEGRDENGKQFFTLNEGWEVVEGEHKPRQPKAKKEAAAAHVEKPHTKDEPTKDEQPEKVEVVTEDEPKVEAQPQVEDDTTNEQALIAAIKNLRGGQVDDAKVRSIFAEELAKLAEPQRAQVSRIATKVAKKEGQVYHENFEDVKKRIARGQWVYLYDPTGSGKNVLAEQIAEALGLPFHYQAHCSDRFELTGFVDANGNYQPTEFYKAYTEGGLFMLDELDASDENALITLNSAANGYFAFPCGTMKAHPDFRCITAGNTCGRGATDDYTGRRVMDVSSIGRFMPRYHNYSDVIDLHDAEGNTDLVEFIHVMRDAKKATGAQIIASPRQIKEIVADEKDGLNLTQTLTDVFAAYLTEDDLNIVKQFVKNDARMSGNKYAKAFAKVQAVVY